jgi:hypothetical protein
MSNSTSVTLFVIMSWVMVVSSYVILIVTGILFAQDSVLGLLLFLYLPINFFNHVTYIEWTPLEEEHLLKTFWGDHWMRKWQSLMCLFPVIFLTLEPFKQIRQQVRKINTSFSCFFLVFRVSTWLTLVLWELMVENTHQRVWLVLLYLTFTVLSLAYIENVTIIVFLASWGIPFLIYSYITKPFKHWCPRFFTGRLKYNFEVYKICGQII